MTGKPEILQSAAIPYVSSADGYHIVLITNSKRTNWIYPKGIIEPDMSSRESAAQEALEEAGVVGVAGDALLDTYQYEKWGGVCVVEVFSLRVDEVLEDWDEKGLRERKIVGIDAAIEMIKPEQKNGLVRLAASLNRANET